MHARALILFAAFLFSFQPLLAQKGKQDSLRSAFNQSLATWEALKESYKNSYSYSVEYGSFTSYGYVTTITVRNGVVVQRVFQDWFKDNPDFVPTLIVERGDELNTHEQGARARTMDEVYLDCVKWLQMDPEKNNLYLELDRKGLIYICGYSPKGCMDDCFKGVHVRSVLRML